MIPYYSEPGIEIYHGDTLEVLSRLQIADRSIDACVTDPPYASGARTEATKKTSGAMLRGERWAQKPIMNDQMTTTGFIWLIRQVAIRVRPMLIEGGSFLSFIDWRQWPNLVGAIETTDLRVNGMVVWDKKHMGLGNGFRSQHELIMFASRGTPIVINKGVANVISHGRDGNSDHPSPKPIGLMRILLSVVASPDSVILDPFMGAGPTLVAAKQLGCKAIGIEGVEKHCEAAADRLSQEVLSI